MKKFFFIFLISFLFLNAFPQENKKVYLFSYFTGNGVDGLHLAYSYDGLKWQALKNNTSFLAPEVGEDKLMDLK